MAFDETEYRHHFAAWAATKAAQRGLLGLNVKVGRYMIERTKLNRLAKGWEYLPEKNTYKGFKKWHRKKRNKIIQQFPEGIIIERLPGDGEFRKRFRGKTIQLLQDQDGEFRNDMTDEFGEEEIERLQALNEHEEFPVNIYEWSARHNHFGLTHGRAAKLINVYMKVLFMGSVQSCMSEENRKKQELIHPPVDAKLLKGIVESFSQVECFADGHDVKFLNKYPICFNNTDAPTPWTKLDSGQYEKIIGAFRHITNNDGLWTIEKYWKGHQ